MYIGTASADRWGIPDRDGFAYCSRGLRALARERGMAVWDGDFFWQDLAPFCIKLGASQTIDPWHHGEPSECPDV